jgi:hypothetical protein
MSRQSVCKRACIVGLTVFALFLGIIGMFFFLGMFLNFQVARVAPRTHATLSIRIVGEPKCSAWHYSI